VIAYFDTSAFVPLAIEEPISAAAQELWDGAHRVVSARILYPEARAALAMAWRLERITSRRLRAAVSVIDDRVSQIDAVEINPALARDAGELAEHMGLRAYDAVHLAAAQAVREDELVVVAKDRALRAAATRLGLMTANLI
jgi:hypothetical protein